MSVTATTDAADVDDGLVARALAEGHRWALEQLMDEFEPFVQLVASHRPHHVVEIGVRRGGTAAVWHTLSTGVVVGIDLPSDFSRERKQLLEAEYSRMEIVLGDSHDPATLNAALALVADRPIDLLFIDGDHSYDGCKLDYQMYSPLVRPGGLIAFHDIVDTPFMRSVDNDVWRFWGELQGDKREFVAGGDWGGIGLVRMP